MKRPNRKVLPGEPRLRGAALGTLTGMEREPELDPRAFELGPFGVRVLELIAGA